MQIVPADVHVVQSYKYFGEPKIEGIHMTLEGANKLIETLVAGNPDFIFRYNDDGLLIADGPEIMYYVTKHSVQP